ncbi:MAG: bifunctional DNA-binding transcriptional regulator/O6-methylguanine-DNA methyltransferase Ada [Gammaproteobacteria bacterium]|nr:bifunctional DNA-binding transcriptional regulator/O6-methylguanine-DNA methyltransferase Ada [Gammaproteobacteria bacterium]
MTNSLSVSLSKTRQFHSDDERWAAIVDRDHSAVGEFVYCVTTTGVYCQPGCAARRPRRENIRFYTSCEDAENAGFRPCKRCRPKHAPLAARHVRSVVTACRLIETSEKLLDLDTLAQAAGMSKYYFHRVFKAVTGFTPRSYSAAHRANRFREELRSSRSVTDAIYNSGFNSTGSFYKQSSEILGMAPATFRNGGVGETIRFAVGECSLGSILVAATVNGVCTIQLGDEPAALVRELDDQFSRAELVGGDKEFESLVAVVVGLVEDPVQGIELPLDIRGTTFQRRIWEVLQEIPVGTTSSYRMIAERVGSPKAARAVALACASNPLAVAIPCHRVIRNNGSLGGYRWGVERKRALLSRETLPDFGSRSGMV